LKFTLGAAALRAGCKNAPCTQVQYAASSLHFVRVRHALNINQSARARARTHMRALSTAARPLRSPHSAVRLFDRFYSELPENLVSSRHRPLGGEPLERIVFNDSGWGWQSEDRCTGLTWLEISFRPFGFLLPCPPRGHHPRKREEGRNRSTLAATLHVSW
jgi:hypothetical protein